MIEVAEETNETVKLPKNIRQIGNPEDSCKIYMEDYVYTYLHPTAEEEKKSKKVCVLLGKIIRDTKKYIFIDGAMAIEPLQDVTSLPEFTDEIWEYIFKQMKLYFDDLEIVGWSITTSFWPLHLLREFENLHRRYFEGNEKVMLLMDMDDSDEKFYRLQNGNMSGQNGYYIYYERNDTMQNFMVQKYQKVEKETEEGGSTDGAVINYRRMLEEKKEQGETKAEHSILYAAGILTVMAACVIGVCTINNYEKMENMQAAIQVLSDSVAYDTTEESTQTVKVQNIESEIKPLQEQNQSADAAATAQDTSIAETAQTSQAETPTTGTDAAAQDVAQAAQPADTAQPAADVPAEAPEAQALSEAQTYLLQGYYVVQSGDNLALISQKIYQNTNMIAALCEKNGIADENTIYVGQKLLLP